MKKQFEDFQKMKIKEACKAIEDMTFSFINPVTNEPTYVPAKHYEGILNKTVEQFLDENLQIEMLNNVYKQMLFLQQEYGKDFIKSLICLDMGIKPSDLSSVQTIALNETYKCFSESKEEQKKSFHFLNQDFVDEFKEALNDKQLHAQYVIGAINNQKEEPEQGIEDDFEDYGDY